MDLYFGFRATSGWGQYLFGLAQNPGAVPVPLSRLDAAHNLRMTAEALIRLKVRPRAISHTIDRVIVLGDDALMYFARFFDPNDPAAQSNSAELRTLAADCFNTNAEMLFFTNAAVPPDTQITMRGLINAIWPRVSVTFRVQAPVLRPPPTSHSHSAARGRHP
jgi:hypothetical protein